MGLTQPDFPPVDPATFRRRPLLDRLRVLSTHWAEYGFGTQKAVHLIYLAKVLILYIGVGVTIATLSSGHSPLAVSEWWNQPVVYQKLVLWTLLVETLGVGGSWGPLAGHFKPMTGGALFWLRPRTIRLPPWPDRVPFTKGDSRTLFDVALYAAIVVNLVVALFLPTVHGSRLDALVPGNHGLVDPAVLYPYLAMMVILGLRDKVPFIAARSEQYLPAVAFFAFLPFVDMILALKLLIVVVWVGAGVSKATWAFAPGAEEKLNRHVVRSSLNTKTQLTATFPDEVADVVMHQMLAWRSMHSQGRGLLSLMQRHLGDDRMNTYDLREAEFSCNSLVAFNFGDGHLHDTKMIAALQRRCGFAPGEFTVVWAESQPIHRGTQDYLIIDAALGVVERGRWRVRDAVNEQPWLPHGPIPVEVTWRREFASPHPGIDAYTSVDQAETVNHQAGPRTSTETETVAKTDTLAETDTPAAETV
ncbi:MULTISPECIES: DUF3556 domain-containing protein [Gordonia]|uniref:DUF3556 domain-containing protein n=1 Tax=Gordonia sihwensis NBRC 108236 TaxID=1223544 RepID=L7LGV4_9ACTN|nr:MULTISPECIES: DUF3556 domain-containing protein [Gordonia]AUH68854.1 hypothetical protein CXX93_11385 [Gordonia sp. YC-JH1]GAC60114.1 hypothetical protein GSI01S_07_00600 [Gordonia sihwensis NBRC 108236]